MPDNDRPDATADEPRDRPVAETSSGLHEDQIDDADIARLRAAAILRSVNLSVSPGHLSRIEPGVTVRSGLRLAIAPLPTKTRVRRANPKADKAVIRRDLRRALAQPVRRRRLLPDQLDSQQQQELYRQLYEQLGERARQLDVAAVFAHIPREAAQSARLADDLRSLYFVLPPDVSPRGVKAGHFLVVLRDSSDQTSTALVRL